MPAAIALFKLTFLLILIAFVLGFISPFVPWIQRDLAPLTRAYFYPFWHCIEDTSSKVNAYCCQDNDFSGPAGVSAGNKNCHDLIISAIAMDFVAVILALLTLIPIGLTIAFIKKRPMALAWISSILCFIIFTSALTAWALWITYAETECVSGSIFPARGYSYGFILVVFASFFALLGTITSYMATMKVHAGAEYIEGVDEKAVYDASSTEPHPPAPTPDMVQWAQATGNDAGYYPVYPVVDQYSTNVV